MPTFGTSIAPIVDGDLVIYAPGGRDTDQLRAYNKVTGEEVWSACHATYELGYSQFAIFNYSGTRQLIYWDPQFLRGLNPQTGEVRGLGTKSLPIRVNGEKPERLPPVYWAAFQLSGDWR